MKKAKISIITLVLVLICVFVLGSTAQAKTNISKTKITLDKTSIAYKFGEKIKPKVTVKNGSKTLKKDTDYTLSYKNNVNPGTGTVTVKGKGSYTGSVNKTFTITKKNVAVGLSALVLFPSVMEGKKYKFSEKPAVSLYNDKETYDKTLKSNKMKEGTDYTLSYTKKSNTKTVVRVAGKGNYCGAFEFPVKTNSFITYNTEKPFGNITIETKTDLSKKSFGFCLYISSSANANKPNKWKWICDFSHRL